MVTIKTPVLAVLLAASAAAQGTLVVTPPLSYTRSYDFPPVGLAGTETLQVNVVNTSTVGPTATAVQACTGAISFANASGTAIGTPVKFAVGPGQVFSASLPFSKTAYSNRGEIVASVQQTVTLGPVGLCSLAISLETFDTGTGVTHAVLTSPAAGFVPLFTTVTPVPMDRP